MDNADKLKWCNYSKHYVSRNLFGNNRARSDGLDTRCKPCLVKRYQDNKEVVRARMALNQRKRREALVQDLGGSCTCCGDSQYEFLQIDHKDGSGGQHRKELGREALNTSGLRKRIAELQVLCGSCHQAKSAWGKCPHQFRLVDMLSS